MGNLNSFELQQIKKETERCIQKGWDNARIAWREMALTTLYRLCVNNQFLTANDFGEEIMKNPLHTHDNRAIGGLIITARKLGWVRNTGQLEGRMSKRFNRGGMSSVWESLLYGKREKWVETVEPAKPEQSAMFNVPSQPASRAYDPTSNLRPDGRRK